MDLSSRFAGLIGETDRPAAGPVWVVFGCTNASSAKAAVTLFFSASLDCFSKGPVGSNWNFDPDSCSKENSSNEGYLDESSSTAATRTSRLFESRAANGSPAGCFAVGMVCGSPAAALGLPRRIGVTSGNEVCCTCVGATFWIPTTGGGDATSEGGDGSLSYFLDSDCVRPV
jgi:hypothetical protein